MATLMVPRKRALVAPRFRGRYFLGGVSCCTPNKLPVFLSGSSFLLFRSERPLRRFPDRSFIARPVGEGAFRSRGNFPEDCLCWIPSPTYRLFFFFRPKKISPFLRLYHASAMQKCCYLFWSWVYFYFEILIWGLPVYFDGGYVWFDRFMGCVLRKNFSLFQATYM